MWKNPIPVTWIARHPVGNKVMINKLISCCRGYTLTELMVAVTLTGVMLSLTLPCYSGYLSKHRLEAAAHQMASDIRHVQQLALTEEASNYQIYFYPAHNRYTLLKGNKVLKTTSLPVGVKLMYTNFNINNLPRQNILEINLRGLPYPAGGHVLLSADDKHKYVVVASITGRVRVSDEKPKN